MGAFRSMKKNYKCGTGRTIITKNCKGQLVATRRESLIIDSECSEDRSFAAFDGVEWMKAVKILGCEYEKSLTSLTSGIRGT